MRTPIILAALLPLAALIIWAHVENQKTEISKDRVEALEDEIGKAQETLRWLSAEWSHLNRPDRISSLAYRFFDELQLVPVTAARYGDVEAIPLRASARIVYVYDTSLLIAAPNAEVSR